MDQIFYLFLFELAICSTSFIMISWGIACLGQILLNFGEVSIVCSPWKIYFIFRCLFFRSWSIKSYMILVHHIEKYNNHEALHTCIWASCISHPRLINVLFLYVSYCAPFIFSKKLFYSVLRWSTFNCRCYQIVQLVIVWRLLAFLFFKVREDLGANFTTVGSNSCFLIH